MVARRWGNDLRPSMSYVMVYGPQGFGETLRRYGGDPGVDVKTYAQERLAEGRAEGE